MQQNILITGNSSGLGHGLSEAYLAGDHHVYGMSRRGCEDLTGKLHDVRCDLGRQEEIAPALQSLLAGVEKIDVAYLNAGIFGELTTLAETSLAQLETIMRVNVWANKFILDWLFSQHIEPRLVIGISSGAALSANRGWGCYSLSKIALNKLMQLYATEYEHTHFIALAPGLVDTAMQDYLCDDKDELIGEYPALEKFRQARGTELMPEPRAAAEAIIAVIPELLALPSGSFADIRTL